MRAAPIAALVGLCATITALTAGPAAAAPPPVAPHQYFQGLVNDKSSGAVVQMACFGAIKPGQMGHPFAGQTIGIALLNAVSGTPGSVGYTGGAATSIIAQLATPVASSAPIATFEFYGDQALSTSALLPCGGTGVIQFLPEPDVGGQPSTVTVEFVGQP